MARRSKAEASWRLLLEACHKVGRLKVIEMLEKEHKTYENWAAWAWGDPASHSLARQLDRKCLKQDETLIRLRSMTDEDVGRSLETGTLVVSGKLGQ
jgi:hypothetical protein